MLKQQKIESNKTERPYERSALGRRLPRHFFSRSPHANINSRYANTVAATQEDSWVSKHSTIARKILTVSKAEDAEEILLGSNAQATLGEFACLELINAAIEKGNISLAISIHMTMKRTRSGSLASSDSLFSWPPTTIQSSISLVLGLCKSAAIAEASCIVVEIRAQGVPKSEEVGFGKVVTSPLDYGSNRMRRTLTVVQPQEGFKLVACAYTKYEYEVFSGKVVTCSSEAVQVQAPNPLISAARALVKLPAPPPTAAVHTMSVQSPDGSSRTFRFGTPTSEVPAQVGERVTYVCCPMKNSSKGTRPFFSASPPGRSPGEAMQCTNHRSGVVSYLVKPPLAGSALVQGPPSWLVPAAILLVGGDVASSLIDPALPALVAFGSASAVASVFAASSVLVPRLKQLSDKDVSIEYSRQQLLGQYALLSGKADQIVSEANEDIRVLARLFQLQSKMESVGEKTQQAYEARIGRVTAARKNIESRLSRKLELLDGYARVMSMIEIEVEMEIEVPAAELEGIEQQMVRLVELEGLQEDAWMQAEARDEVEKLLRSV